MPPADPSKGGLSLSPMPGAGEGGLGRENSDFCLICGIPSWFMPLRDRSGLSSQPFWHGLRGRSGPSSCRLIGVCRDLRCTHSTQHVQVQRGLPRFLIRFGFIGFRPLHLVPLSSFSPSHTSVPLFSFMSSCLHVFHLILSFVCAHIGPGLSVFVHNYMYVKLRF